MEGSSPRKRKKEKIALRLFEPLDVSLATADTSIMRLVKRITAAREKALESYHSEFKDFERQTIYCADYFEDIEVLENDSDIFGASLSRFDSRSGFFSHCILDHGREYTFESKKPYRNWIRETFFLANILSFDESDSDVEEEESKGGIYVRDKYILSKCVGVIAFGEDKCSFIFKLPPSTDPNVRSLRKALTDPECQTHPIDDRYRLALHLAQSLFLIHSAGILHRHIRPEAVYLADQLQDDRENKYPKRLGKAFLLGYSQTRQDRLPTDNSPDQSNDFDPIYYVYGRYEEMLSGQISFESNPGRSKMYRPPGHLVDFGGKRNDRYRMIDDIYGLGVCLLEIGIWRSLFKRDEKKSFIR